MRPSGREPIFVGREREQRQLQAAFEATAAGHGALIMLAGEPGIGKTSLCRELASYVELQGGLPLLGHCYPEGSASAPFQPFVEALEHVCLAELLLDEADDATWSEALEYLNLAIPELQDMHMQPALERALTLRDRHAASARHSTTNTATSNMLTPREREINELMATGFSNRGIAEKLVITEATVEVHVKHILRKLGLRSRRQLAGLPEVRQSRQS
jgi:DNA-binding CsgD family transcriptional regulator